MEAEKKIGVDQGGDEIEPNWYIEQYKKRIFDIKQAGEQRNVDRKIFQESSDKYDSLKRSFYNITKVAIDEEVISEHGNISVDYYY